MNLNGKLKTLPGMELLYTYTTKKKKKSNKTKNSWHWIKVISNVLCSCSLNHLFHLQSIAATADLLSEFIKRTAKHLYLNFDCILMEYGVPEYKTQSTEHKHQLFQYIYRTTICKPPKSTSIIFGYDFAHDDVKKKIKLGKNKPKIQNVFQSSNIQRRT